MFSVSLPGPIRRYFDTWFDNHNPPSRDAILLHNRRLYILPTGFGYLFAIMLLFLFFAAINYQNSMAFVLTFMLTSLGIISLWHTHKNLLGIAVKMQIPRRYFVVNPASLSSRSVTPTTRSDTRSVSSMPISLRFTCDLSQWAARS